MTDQGESPKERVDRELIELLNGLRVALPGVQVLFAFLLTVPFAQGSGRTSDFQRLVYVICLLCAAVATGFYIAPAAQHRVLFRSHNKERLLRRANLYGVIANAVLIGAVASAVRCDTDEQTRGRRARERPVFEANQETVARASWLEERRAISVAPPIPDRPRRDQREQQGCRDRPRATRSALDPGSPTTAALVHTG